jgi:hypothetical protein
MQNVRLARQSQKNNFRQATRRHKKLSSLLNETTLVHNTTTQPIYHHPQPIPLPSHSNQRYGTRQQGRHPNPPQPTVNEKRREARNDFFHKNQRHLTEFALYQIKSNTTFFSCFYFFSWTICHIFCTSFFLKQKISFIFYSFQIFFVKRCQLDLLFICYLVFYLDTQPDTALRSSFLIHETHLDMFVSSFHCTVRCIQDKQTGIVKT